MPSAFGKQHVALASFGIMVPIGQVVEQLLHACEARGESAPRVDQFGPARVPEHGGERNRGRPNPVDGTLTQLRNRQVATRHLDGGVGGGEPPGPVVRPERSLSREVAKVRVQAFGVEHRGGRNEFESGLAPPIDDIVHQADLAIGAHRAVHHVAVEIFGSSRSRHLGGPPWQEEHWKPAGMGEVVDQAARRG